MTWFEHFAIFDTLPYQQCCLIEHMMPQTNCQRCISLWILGIVVDILIQQVQDGEEELFLTRIVQGRLLINIHNIEINWFTIEQGLQYLHFVIVAGEAIILLIICFYLNETVEYGRSSVFVNAIYLDTVFQKFLENLRRRIEVCGIWYQMMKGIPLIQVTNICECSIVL